MKATKIGNKKRNGGMFAVILITALLSANANAVSPKFHLLHDSFEMASVDYTIENRISDLSGLKEVESETLSVEEEMETESWMINIDDKSWQQDFEEEIPLEDWMSDTNDNNWNTTGTEEEIVIECWMLNPSGWLN